MKRCVMTRKASKRKFTVTGALAGPHKAQFGFEALAGVWNEALWHRHFSRKSQDTLSLEASGPCWNPASHEAFGELPCFPEARVAHWDNRLKALKWSHT